MSFITNFFYKKQIEQHTNSEIIPFDTLLPNDTTTATTTPTTPPYYILSSEDILKNRKTTTRCYRSLSLAKEIIRTSEQSLILLQYNETEQDYKWTVIN